MSPSSHPPGEVRLQIRDGVAHIELHNPHRYNAMSLAMWRGLADIVAALENDTSARVLLLRGAGSKAFVSGADISEFGELRNSPEQVAAYGAAVHAAQYALSACSKPVVACIHGVCMGGGIGLALACDLRYCADDARFRMPAARLGLGYDLDGTRRMADIVGPARTAEMIFTARTFDGREAERIGLVHKSHAPAQLDEEVARIVADVALNAPLTLKAAKLSIRHLLGDPAARDTAEIERATQACFDSNDYKEGQQAFREKRPPRFTGA